MWLAPGFSYAEEHVGTNGIGTALEGGGPARVFGHEHYVEHLEEFACTGVPVRHPVTHKVLGVVDLTCWRRDAGTMERGARLYDQRCAYCHGDAGQGAAGAYPPLAGNRAVLMANPANLIQIVRHGGYLPATAGNPRPYGMPPFGQVLDDGDIAAVLTYVPDAWGNDAPSVSLQATMRR